jgi:hypothetical protein
MVASKLRAELDETIITVKNSKNEKEIATLSVFDVINELLAATFQSKTPLRGSVLEALQSTLRRIVEYKLLVDKARELGMENSPEVRHDVDMMMGAYFANQVRDAVMDTVQLTDQDLNDFLHKYYASDLRNISLTLIEYKMPTIDEAIGVFNILNRKDGSSRKEDVIGYATDTINTSAYLLEHLGGVFSTLKPGDIYGPVKDRSGFTLYKLISKKLVRHDSEFVRSANTFKEAALSEKKERILYQYIGKLASDEDVKIFIQPLKRVEVKPLQMFTVRKIGFGGEINAVPYMPPCDGWPKYVKSGNLIVP